MILTQDLAKLKAAFADQEFNGADIVRVLQLSDFRALNAIVKQLRRDNVAYKTYRGWRFGASPKDAAPGVIELCPRAALPRGDCDDRGVRAIPAGRAMPLLSPTEVDIAHLVSEGREDKEIAVIIGVSYDAARQRLRVLSRKIGAHNRAMVAAWYARNEATR